MTGTTKRKYDKVFKEEAVKLVEDLLEETRLFSATTITKEPAHVQSGSIGVPLTPHGSAKQ